jgi:hypothetical protein
VGGGDVVNLKCNNSKITVKVSNKTVKITEIPQKFTAICAKNESTPPESPLEILS